MTDSSACGCPHGFHEYGAHAPGYVPVDLDRPRGPGIYAITDVALLTTSETIALIDHATVEAELDADSCPHIVITRDTDTGVVTYTGPFPTGLEALTVAHEFVEQNRALDPRWRFTLTVAPLFPR